MTEWRRSVWVVRGAESARLAEYLGKWALMVDGDVAAIGTEVELRASGWAPWDGGAFPKNTGEKSKAQGGEP